MAATERLRGVGPRPVAEFEEAAALPPGEDRLTALRDAAVAFRRRFGAAGTVRAVRTLPLVAAPVPTAFAFQGAARGISPWAWLEHRALVVQFEGPEGESRTLVWHPVLAEAVAAAPFHARVARWRAGRALGPVRRLGLRAGLASIGIRAEDVDYLACADLDLHDPRRLLGSEVPAPGESEPPAGLFPAARLLLPRAELSVAAAPHPTRSAWAVPGALDGVPPDRLELVEGDVELGAGVALLGTPGGAGPQALCLNTPDGIWLASTLGVAADSWHPHLSDVPGVRRWAELHGREVVMRAPALEAPADHYDAMVREKAVADAHRDDPRWLSILPCAELADQRRQWPVVPSYRYGGIDLGRIEPAAR